MFEANHICAKISTFLLVKNARGRLCFRVGNTDVVCVGTISLATLVTGKKMQESKQISHIHPAA